MKQSGMSANAVYAAARLVFTASVTLWYPLGPARSGMPHDIVTEQRMPRGKQTRFANARPAKYISRGRWGSRQRGGFLVVVVIVALFVPNVCPVGGGMWGIFGKPLQRAIWNTWVRMLY